MSQSQENLNTSFRTHSREEYDNKWWTTKAGYTLMMGIKNIGRGIAYIVKKPYYALYKDLLVAFLVWQADVLMVGKALHLHHQNIVL